LSEEKCVSFIADGMLGSTARKLRILGYNTIFDAKADDKELLRTALTTGRTLLTNDNDLFKSAKKKGASAILVAGKKDELRIFQVLSRSGVGRIDIDHLNSRCSICNGELIDIGVTNNFGSQIFLCLGCEKRYWKGSHWKKIRRLFNSVNSKLQETSKLEDEF
jgi:uncharacterized protein